jgi:hypothetical protein
MISVVVCSIDPVLSANLEAKIANTIGVPYETIVIDNRTAKKCIGAVYNQGAQSAQFPFICFVHEDVVFSTPNWGQKILQYFDSNPLLGLIGLAGSKYKSRTHSGWYTGISALDCANILHVNRQGQEYRIFAQPSPGKSVERVVCIDGVFMCCRQEAWRQVMFNESPLDGFHLYDIDFSSRVSRAYETIVTYEIDVFHLTEGGSFDNDWVKYTFLWHRMQRQLNRLPLALNEPNLSNRLYERKIAKTWLSVLMKSKITMRYRVQWILKMHWTHSIVLLPNVVSLLLYPILKPLLIRVKKKP